MEAHGNENSVVQCPFASSGRVDRIISLKWGGSNHKQKQQLLRWYCNSAKSDRQMENLLPELANATVPADSYRAHPVNSWSSAVEVDSILG